MKTNIQILIYILLTISLISCGSPSIKDIEIAFLKDNPNCEIISIVPIEGDFSTVYIEIKYKEKDEVIEKKVIYQYFKDQIGEWILNDKTIDSKKLQ